MPSRPGFQLDFEVSMLRSIAELFPSSNVKGCAFHFSQCLWRKVQDLGICRYYDDPLVKKFIRCAGALALVPLSQIDSAWLEIDGESPPSDHPAYSALEDSKKYFINTWLENGAVFPRYLWNHFGNFGTRTTNHLEGWHQALNRGLGRAHVNIFEMVSHLQKIEKDFKTQMLFLSMGRAPKPAKKKYVKANERLMRLVTQFESNQITLIEYVQKVGFNLKS
ncbi:uncharacterized protein LOC108863911 [Galendromus occidentalis]|uniref:Uncharacterized protein LOC108863911 n=1 Tax=Galendromus occidentalis TaxID=34638 RepID=A0AAJ7L2X4_9ACAR|nr:uncharacterized protein LOC108863911 [Galendromus occidentalis]